jgi:hypothetical protein
MPLTAVARSSERFLLAEGSPVLSVCPSTRTSTAGIGRERL